MLFCQQKHAMQIIWQKGNFEHTRLLFQLKKVLNVYKLNILNVMTYLYKVNQKLLRMFFFPDFKNHIIFTQLDSWNYIQPIHNIKPVKYSISIRGAYIWNSFLSPREKQVTTMHKFKAITKSSSSFPRGSFLYPSGFLRSYFAFILNTTDTLLGLDDKTKLVFCKSLPFL